MSSNFEILHGSPTEEELEVITKILKERKSKIKKRVRSNWAKPKFRDDILFRRIRKK